MYLNKLSGKKPKSTYCVIPFIEISRKYKP